MSEIPVVIKAVDQLTGPAKAMSAGAASALSTIKPAGVDAFNAVTQSAGVTAKAVSDVGRASMDTRKDLLATEEIYRRIQGQISASNAAAYRAATTASRQNEVWAQSVNRVDLQHARLVAEVMKVNNVGTKTAEAMRSGFDGVNRSTIGLIGSMTGMPPIVTRLSGAMTVLSGSMMAVVAGAVAIGAAAVYIAKMAYEFSGASAAVEKLMGTFSKAREIIGKDMFGPNTVAGKALISILESLNGVMESTVSVFERHKAIIELSMAPMNAMLKVWELEAAAVEKVANAMNAIDKAGMKWWAGGLGDEDPRFARNREKLAKLKETNAKNEEFAAPLRAASAGMSDFGLLSDVDMMIKVIDANDAIKKVYADTRAVLKPIMNDISFSSKKMWASLTGASDIPEAGRPGLWSGPGSDALNGIKNPQKGGAGNGVFGGGFAPAMLGTFTMVQIGMQTFATEMQKQTSIVAQSFNNMGQAITEGLFSSIEAVVAGQESVKQALRNIASDAVRAMVSQYRVKAVAEAGEALASLAIGDARGAATHAAAAVKFGAVAGLGAAAAGALSRDDGDSRGSYRGGYSPRRSGYGQIAPVYSPAVQVRSPNVTIQIMGNVIGQREYIDRLADQIAKRVGDGARIGVMA